jgi:thiol-disulfide isomerase/thioredoxin
MQERGKDDGLVVTIAHVPSAVKSGLPNYRPVVFDVQGKRYDLKSDCAVGTKQVMMRRYTLDARFMPPDRVRRLGIEVLTDEGVATLARLANEKAKKAGIEILPMAWVGQPYEFTLTTSDGRKVCSKDWRGKVVVIDFWATTCSPCMALQPELKGIYERWHGTGLEVIGINLDEDAEKAKKACTRLALPWPQVMVPAEDKKRELWQEASGIGPIPRVLLVDGQGMLREDTPERLGEAVEALLRRSALESSKGARP